MIDDFETHSIGTANEIERLRMIRDAAKDFIENSGNSFGYIAYEELEKALDYVAVQEALKE